MSTHLLFGRSKAWSRLVGLYPCVLTTDACPGGTGIHRAPLSSVGRLGTEQGPVTLFENRAGR